MYGKLSVLFTADIFIQLLTQDCMPLYNKGEMADSAAEDERWPPFILLHKGEVSTHTQLRKQYHEISIEHRSNYCKIFLLVV